MRHFFGAARAFAVFFAAYAFGLAGAAFEVAGLGLLWVVVEVDVAVVDIVVVVFVVVVICCDDVAKSLPA